MIPGIIAWRRYLNTVSTETLLFHDDFSTDVVDNDTGISYRQISPISQDLTWSSEKDNYSSNIIVSDGVMYSVPYSEYDYYEYRDIHYYNRAVLASFVGIVTNPTHFRLRLLYTGDSSGDGVNLKVNVGSYLDIFIPFFVKLHNKNGLWYLRLADNNFDYQELQCLQQANPSELVIDIVKTSESIATVYVSCLNTLLMRQLNTANMIFDLDTITLNTIHVPAVGKGIDYLKIATDGSYIPPAYVVPPPTPVLAQPTTVVFTLADTANATQNTLNNQVYLNVGQTLRVGTTVVPGSSVSSDSMLSDTIIILLDPSMNQVDFSDNTYTSASFVQHTALVAGFYTIVLGCYDTTSCEGVLAWEVLD